MMHKAEGFKKKSNVYKNRLARSIHTNTHRTNVGTRNIAYTYLLNRKDFVKGKNGFCERGTLMPGN